MDPPRSRTLPQPYLNPIIEGWDSETTQDGLARIISTSSDTRSIGSIEDVLMMLSGRRGAGKRNFWWNIDFDVTACLKWDQELLYEVTTEGHGKWGPYAISYIPRKMLKVKHERRQPSIFYDAWQFYRQGLEKAAQTYLGRDAPDTKAQRDDLWGLDWSEIAAYCRWDATATRDLAQLYVDGLHKIDLYPKHFISNGSLAQSFILTHGDVPTFYDYPKVVNHAAWLSMRGALIDVWKRGEMDVWKYDLKSAYPAVMMDLPDFRHGRWVQGIPKEAQFGLVNATYRPTDETPPIIPTHTGTQLTYPRWENVETWVTLDEHRLLSKTCPSEVNMAWSFLPSTEHRPWRDLLSRLMGMKAKAEGDPARYTAVKALINSFYGKTVQRVDSKSGIVTGPLFNPVAGTLTLGRTRTQVAEAAMQDLDSVAIVATDSVAATRPLYLDIGEDVGQWEVEAEGANAIVAHPGVYQVEGESMHTRGWRAKGAADMWEACRYHGKTMEVIYDRPWSAREAVNHGDMEKAGLWHPHTYSLGIRNTRRLWENRPRGFMDLLDQTYHSRPIPSVALE